LLLASSEPVGDLVRKFLNGSIAMGNRAPQSGSTDFGIVEIQQVLGLTADCMSVCD
jgi:hypothetical protein